MSEKKDIILDVAENLFAKHGFEGTTTRAISDQAEVNIAMLSYYFGSKEKLLEAVMDRHAHKAYEWVEEIHKEEPDPLRRLKKWNSAYVEFAFANPRPVIIAHRERSLINDRPHIMDNVEEASNRMKGYFTETIETGKNQGLFRDIDIELTLHTFLQAVETLITNHQWVKKTMTIDGDSSSENDKVYPEEFVGRVKDYLESLIDEFVCK